MRHSSSKRLGWMGVLAAGVYFVAGATVGSSETGPQCSSAPCTYFEKGQPFPGTCGSKKDDTKACYCFKRDQKAFVDAQLKGEAERPSQVQVGCKQ